MTNTVFLPLDKDDLVLATDTIEEFVPPIKDVGGKNFSQFVLSGGSSSVLQIAPLFICLNFLTFRREQPNLYI